MEGKRRVVEFWKIHDQLFHIGSEQRAEAYKKHNELNEDMRKVYVCVPVEFFVGTVHNVSWFDGWIFDSETEANKTMERHNRQVS